MSILTTAVVLKDGEPRSRAWTTTDHLQSLCLVMFCTISIDLMYGLSLISPVDVLMSKMLSGSAFMMEYSIMLLGSSASSSTAWTQTRIKSKSSHLHSHSQFRQFNFKQVVESSEFMPSGTMRFEFLLLANFVKEQKLEAHKPVLALVLQWSWSFPGSSGWTLADGHFGRAQWQKPLQGCISPQCLQLLHRNYILTSLQHLKRPRAACKWCQTWGEWEIWNRHKTLFNTMMWLTSQMMCNSCV